MIDMKSSRPVNRREGARTGGQTPQEGINTGDRVDDEKDEEQKKKKKTFCEKFSVYPCLKKKS